MTPLNPPADRARAAAQRAAAPCNFCDAPIVWAATKASRIPVNATPDPDGNVLISVTRAGLHADIIGRKAARDSHREQGWSLFLPHKLTCPKEGEWSRTLRAADNAALRNRPAKGATPGGGLWA